MPELPEVITISRALNKKLSGKHIFSATVNDKSRYAKGGAFSGQEILKCPHKVLAVGSRGKKIIFYLQSLLPTASKDTPHLSNSSFGAEHKDESFGAEHKDSSSVSEVKNNIPTAYMVSSLGMEGHWQYEEGKHSGIKFKIGAVTPFEISKSSVREEKYPTAQSLLPSPMKLENNSPPEYNFMCRAEFNLYYDDSRHFGLLDVVNTTAGLQKLLKEVGPDLLQDSISVQQYYEVLSRKRLSGKTIMSFLLEQKYFSGVGNYLRSEILYACRLDPRRTLGTLTQNDIISLYTNTMNTLQESLKFGGLTIATYWDPDGRKGLYTVRVYGKDKDPLGNPVEQIKDEHDRTVHWVPKLQV
jgi:formamidopyrimidine-DNA glycosylase